MTVLNAFLPDGTPTTVDASKAADLWSRGEIRFREGQRIPVRAPDGSLGDIDATELEQALSSGFGFADPREVEAADEAAARRAEAGEQPGRAFVEGAARGLTLGLSDVMLGSDSPEARVIGAAPFGEEAIAEAVNDPEAFREGVLARREENPVASGVGSVGGAIASGLALPVGLAGRGATALGRTAATAVQGAAEGAVAEVGLTMGDAALHDEELTGEMLVAAAGEGAKFGALFGGAVQGVAEVARPTLRGVGKFMSRDRVNSAIDELAVGHLRPTPAQLDRLRGRDIDVEDIGRILLEEKLISPRIGRDTFVDMADDVLDNRLGPRMGEVLDQLDAASPVEARVDLRALVRRFDDLAEENAQWLPAAFRRIRGEIDDAIQNNPALAQASDLQRKMENLEAMLEGRARGARRRAVDVREELESLPGLDEMERRFGGPRPRDPSVADDPGGFPAGLADESDPLDWRQALDPAEPSPGTQPFDPRVTGGAGTTPTVDIGGAAEDALSRLRPVAERAAESASSAGRALDTDALFFRMRQAAEESAAARGINIDDAAEEIREAFRAELRQARAPVDIEDVFARMRRSAEESAAARGVDLDEAAEEIRDGFRAELRQAREARELGEAPTAPAPSAASRAGVDQTQPIPGRMNVDETQPIPGRPPRERAARELAERRGRNQGRRELAGGLDQRAAMAERRLEREIPAMRDALIARQDAAYRMGFGEAHSLRRAIDKHLFRGRPGNLQDLSPQQVALHEARRAVNEEIRDAMRRAGDAAEPGSPLRRALDDWSEANRRYQAIAWAREVGRKSAAREKAKELAGGFDFGISPALAVATGNPGWMIAGWLAGVFRKWADKHGKAAGASAGDALARMLGIRRAAEATDTRMARMARRLVRGNLSGKLRAVQVAKFDGVAEQVQQMPEDPLVYDDDGINGIRPVDIADVSINAAATVGATRARQAQALRQRLREMGALRNDLSDPLGRAHRLLSDTQRARFLRYHQAVTDPLSVIKAPMRMSPEHARGIRDAYPALYQRLLEKVSSELAEAKDPPPYQARLRIGMLFPEITPDATMRGAFISRWQEPFRERHGGAEGGAMTGVGGAPPAPNNAPTLDESQLTRAQRLAEE